MNGSATRPANACEPSSPRFFSQNGEDFFAWSVLGRPRTGFFVEVGAFDGIYLSGTYMLEGLGWRGVCVEPHPRFVDLCRLNRPNSHTVRAACVSDETQTEVRFLAESLGIYSGVAVNEDQMRQKYLDLGKPVESNLVRVPARTLNSILGECDAPRVDFMTVDTEGSELQVLDGLDFQRYAPRLMIIEADDDQARDEVRDAMASRGYQFLRRIGNVNLAFSSDPAVIAAARGFRINCTLEAHVHPEGLASTAGRYRTRRVVAESFGPRLLAKIRRTVGL